MIPRSNASPRARRVHDVERRRLRPRRFRRALPGRELPEKDLAVRGIVVDDQHAKPSKFVGRELSRHCQRRGLDQRQPKPERAATTHSACDANVAPHQLDELFGNGQPQASAAELPRCRSVDLRERPGRAGRAALAGRRCPYPRRRTRTSICCVVFALDRDVHLHLPALGEFDGVAQQVHDDLLQAMRIAAHARRTSSGGISSAVRGPYARPSGQHVRAFLP